MESVTVNTEVSGPDAPVEGGEVTGSEVSRPEWLPEKFENAEAMAKSYMELEKTASQPTEAPTDEAPAPTSDAPAGMESMQSFFDEYAKDGGLSDDSYAKLLENHNVDKAMADDYISLKNNANQVDTDAQINEWFDIAGGEEGYKEMSEWALTNKSPEEQAEIDAGLTSNDPNIVTKTIQGLYISYMQNGGQPPQLVSGDNSMGTQGVQPITSTYELTQLMSDPRYTNNDKAYHAMIDARLSKGGILG